MLFFSIFIVENKKVPTTPQPFWGIRPANPKIWKFTKD
jgi:hypothetical protein